MYPLLMEELARDRERALLRQAADRRLAAQASSASAREVERGRRRVWAPCGG